MRTLFRSRKYSKLANSSNSPKTIRKKRKTAKKRKTRNPYNNLPELPHEKLIKRLLKSYNNEEKNNIIELIVRKMSENFPIIKSTDNDGSKKVVIYENIKQLLVKIII